MPDIRVSSPAYPHGALPVGTRLGEFEIRRVLGVGGFGIVYLAFDHLLERDVALKEYMPATLVDRNETMHVSLVSQEHADTFALGLRSFVNEARLLARFDHPSLVKVHRFWEANGTAYMAMSLYKGRNARDVRQELVTKPDEAWVRAMIDPLLGAIERLHGEDVFHRDIAPDNIMIEPDGRPVLLDFGAARRVITDRSQALTAILKPSYAPIEQYADVGGMKQGAWTDIYALGATMHFLLLGRPPPPAPGRSIQDTMQPLEKQAVPGCSTDFLAVIDWMLAPLPNDRPQNVAAVRDALAGRIAVPRRAPPSPYERTAPLEGPPGSYGNEDATVIVPRPSATPAPRAPVADEDATVIIPRSAMPNLGAAPPRPPVADEDATVITPRPTAFAAPKPAAPPPSPAAPPAPAPAPAQPQTVMGASARPNTTQYAPRARGEQAMPTGSAGPAPSRQAPPPVAARPAEASSSSWLVPVLAGVVVAAGLGGGLWWYFTRPAVDPSLAAVAPPASQAASMPSQTPAPAPAPAPVTDPAPVATPVATQPPPVADTAPAPVVAPAPAATPTPSPSAQPPAATPRPATRPAEASPRRADAPPAKTAPPTSTYSAPPSSTAPSATPAPAPAPTPAPAQPQVADAPKPAPVDDGRPKSPSERCAKELPLVRLICIDLACNRSEFNKHPECVKLRAEQAQKRLLDGN